jgi:hypothetical protein
MGAQIRVRRGVYRVGHSAPNLEASSMAAVLACDPGAVLYGRAAAHLLGLGAGDGARPRGVVAEGAQGAWRPHPPVARAFA